MDSKYIMTKSAFGGILDTCKKKTYIIQLTNMEI